MKTIDNVDHFLVEDLQKTLHKGSRLYWIGNCFSLSMFEALKPQLETCHSLEFIFPEKINILEEEAFPALQQPRSLLEKRGLLIDCLRWIREKARFKVNPGLKGQGDSLWIRNKHHMVSYTDKADFTASPASILRQKLPYDKTYLTHFQNLWTDTEYTEDVTDEVMERIMKLW